MADRKGEIFPGRGHDPKENLTPADRRSAHLLERARRFAQR